MRGSTNHVYVHLGAHPPVSTRYWMLSSRVQYRYLSTDRLSSTTHHRKLRTGTRVTSPFSTMTMTQHTEAGVLISSSSSFEARLSALEAKVGYVILSSNDEEIKSKEAASHEKNVESQDEIVAIRNQKNDADDIHDFDHRLSALEVLHQQLVCSMGNPTSLLGWDQMWKESDSLWQELDPGMALTYQQQPTLSSQQPTSLSHQQPPSILYRRLEILAKVEQMEQDLDYLKVISQQLQISAKPTTSVTTTTTSPSFHIINEQDVTQAPLLIDTAIIVHNDNDHSCSSDTSWAEQLKQVDDQIYAIQKRCDRIQQRMQFLLNSYHTIIVIASEKIILAQDQIKSNNSNHAK